MPGRSLHSLIELRTSASAGLFGSFHCEVMNASDRVLSEGQVVRIATSFPAGNWIPVELQAIDPTQATFDGFNKTMGVIVGDDIPPGEAGLIAWAGRVRKINVAQGGAVVAGELLRPHYRVPGACEPIRLAADMHKRWAFAIAGETKNVGSNDFDIGQVIGILMPWCV